MFPNFLGPPAASPFPNLPPEQWERLTLRPILPHRLQYVHSHISCQGPLSVMKIFSCYQTFRFIRLTKPPGRRFHKEYQLQVPLTLDDLEAIMLCERPLPKSFNFAADVLDQWSQKEKL